MIIYIVIPAAVALAAYLYRISRSQCAGVDTEERSILLDHASSEAVHL